MNKTIWVWQNNLVRPAVTRGGLFGPYFRGQGFTRVCQKAMDGADWMRGFDDDRNAVGNVAECVAIEAAYNAEGLAVDWWVIPQKDWPRAVAVYAVLANTVRGRLFLDLEPYPGYWGDQADPSEFLTALFGTVLDRSRLWLCYDPRVPRWLGDWYLSFGGVAPMLYAGSWVTQLRPVGRPAEPILYFGESAGAWWSTLNDPVAWNEDGRTGYGVFRAPIVDPGQISFVGQMS